MVVVAPCTAGVRLDAGQCEGAGVVGALVGVISGAALILLAFIWSPLQTAY